jgi:DNA-binding transcriptional ArsR family regulator
MTNSAPILPNSPPLEEIASTFAALGSEQRLAVLRTLVRAGPGGLTIGALGDRTGVTGSTLTHHMRVLAQAGLVRQERQGRQIICVGADYDRMEVLSRFLLSECCADSIPESAHNHG